jgi:CNT family concentrative nucleoside transporter
VAYAQFASDLGGSQVLQPRSAIILTYALLGFANFSSIAIQIGGIGGLAPERKKDIAALGLRAMIAGNLAAFTSASIAGMLA